MNIFLVLNKKHRKYQFTYGIFRHVYYAIFNQCTLVQAKSTSTNSLESGLRNLPTFKIEHSVKKFNG